jgi:hypothetical protein
LLVRFHEIRVYYSGYHSLRTIGKYHGSPCGMIGELESLQLLWRLYFEELSKVTVLVVESVEFLDTPLAESSGSTPRGMTGFGQLKHVNGVFALQILQVDRVLSHEYSTPFLRD